MMIIIYTIQDNVDKNIIHYNMIVMVIYTVYQCIYLINKLFCCLY